MAEFDPDKYLQDKQANQGEFNPDAYLQSKAPLYDAMERLVNKSKSSGPSELRSGYEGALTGATLGFKPQIAGASGALMEAIGGQTNPDESLLETYRTYRDLEKKQQEELQKANPKSFLAGEVLGGLAPALATSGSVAGLSTAEQALQAAKVGASIGGLQGLAAGEADLTKGEVLPTLKEAGIGAAVGGGLSGIVGAAAPQIPKLTASLADILQNTAAKRAVAATGATKGQIKNLLNAPTKEATSPNRLIEHGKNLLKPSEFTEGESLVSSFSSPGKILERAETLEQNSGKEIGDILKQFDSLSSTDKPELRQQFFNPTKVSKQIEELQSQFIKNDKVLPSFKEPYNELQNLINTMQEFGNQPIDFTEASRLKNLVDKLSYGPDGKLKNELLGQARGIINAEIERSADVVSQSAGSPELLNQYKQAKDMFRTAKDTINATTGKVAGEIKNRDLGITDYMAGIGGAAAHGGPVGLAAAGINKLARTYGNNLMAVGAKKTADVMQSVNKAFTQSPQALESIGNDLVSSGNETNARLGKILIDASQKDDIGRNALIFSLQQNPTYRDAMKKILEDKESKP